MTRPDYCPVAQEPCQAMCVLSDVRCKIRDTPPAAPAQRQPLTKERIGQIIEQCRITMLNYCSDDKQTEFARAIEAAHGITGENT